ncbi:MAG: DUF4363 family protein [Faecalibacterium sp.]|nr:DUF4363 family protein [Ruminococcus sp.]MCM1391650.1 DUF4363 family protein [Ruminococcus sp.]MCM1485741.1 DUF4363 family protein [Faecalibacterium sp.]
MKRLIFSLLLLAACFALCVTSYVSLKDKTDELTLLLESASDSIAAEELDDAAQQIKSANNKWSQYHEWFSIFLNHKLLEKLSIDIPALMPLLEKNKSDTALEKIEECINLLKAIVDGQKISIENVL